jgi:hypothetical protein
MPQAKYALKLSSLRSKKKPCPVSVIKDAELRWGLKLYPIFPTVFTFAVSY